MSNAPSARWAHSFRSLADFNRRFRIRSWLLAIFLALTPALQPATPAKSDCKVGDVIDAMTQFAKTTLACEPVCENTYECYAVALLAADLTFLVKQNVDISPICVDGPAKVGELMDKLVPFLSSEFTQEHIADLSSYMKYVSDALAFVKCACETEELNIKNGSSFGACADQIAGAAGCASVDVAGFTVAYDCTPGNVVSKAYDAVKEWCCHNLPFLECDDGPPPPNYVDCPDGSQSDRDGHCYPCSKIPHGITLSGSGECGCDSLYSIDGVGFLTDNVYIDSFGNKTEGRYHVVKQCVCLPPREVDAYGRCLCPKGQEEKAGVCVACDPDKTKYVPYHYDDKGVGVLPYCGQCPLAYQQSKDDPTACEPMWNCDPKADEVPDPRTPGKCNKCDSNQRVADDEPIYRYRCEDCITGRKPSADFSQCVPACDGTKKEYFDRTSASCKTCSSDERISYTGGDVGGLGKCIQCDRGQTASNDQLQCVPKCGPGQVVTPVEKIAAPVDAGVAPDVVKGGSPSDLKRKGDEKSAADAALLDGTKSAIDAPLAGDAKSYRGQPLAAGSNKTIIDAPLQVGLCTTCPDNTYARYVSNDSSIGECVACAAGTHSYAGALECIPLNCGASGYRDPDNPNSCKYCPASQIYIPAENQFIQALGGQSKAESIPGHCGCGPNQRLDGDKCVCAAGTFEITNPTIAGPPVFAGCACPEGASLDPSTFACKCPAGAKPDSSGRKCTCAEGRLVGGKCVLSRQLPKDCSPLGSSFVNDAENPSRCIRCTGVRVANGDRTACITKPSTTVVRPKGEDGDGKARRSRGDTWLNPQPEPPSPVRKCGPNLKPNVQGTGCVPSLDMPDFGTPGSAIPGGAPAMPSFRRH